MSCRPLDLTQRQVRALAQGAKKAGCVAVIEIGNTVIRLVPEDREIPKVEPAEVDDDDDFRL